MSEMLLLKKILVISFIIFSSSLFPQAAPNSYEKLIIGKWSNYGYNKSVICTLEFTKDNILEIKSYKDYDAFPVEIRNKKLKYSINGESLIIGDMFIYDIRKMNDSEMYIFLMECLLQTDQLSELIERDFNNKKYTSIVQALNSYSLGKTLIFTKN